MSLVRSRVEPPLYSPTCYPFEFRAAALGVVLPYFSPLTAMGGNRYLFVVTPTDTFYKK